jgi:hypothetical protein
MGVRDVDGMQSSTQRGIDIRPRAVADHHRPRRVELSLRDQKSIGGGVFLDRDSDAAEERAQPRTFEFGHLLLRLSLCKEQQPMTLR